MDHAKDRIESLRHTLNEHNHKYYVLDAPEISDHDFDMLMKELEKLESEHPEYADPLSPTQRVGSDLTLKGFEQRLHDHPMLSLSNTYTIAEVDDFVRRCKDSLPMEDVTIVGELKFDGTSISLTYENGRLVRAVTRGDGEKGDVVTENVKTIRSIPLELHGTGWPEKFEIRGEIVLPWAAFERINQTRAFNEEPLFANPRNAASGTLKMQNSAEVAKRGLDAYLYYLISDNLPYDNHYDNMMAAKQWGFKVSDAMTRLSTIDEVDTFINYWDTARKELPIATDGLVFKVNNLRQQLNLGYTAKSPRWAIAYKFPAERALTPLKFVSFEVGRSGIITPVANLEPVLLSGTVVKRASLHNQDIMRALDIHHHDYLYVEKGGEIIPKITGVDISKREPGSKKVEFCHDCPSCGTPLVRPEGEAAWMCPNKYGCTPQITGRVEHFVGRRMMDIDGIGQETVADLFECQLISDAADLYSLTPQQLAILPGFAQKSVDRLMSGIEKSKTAGYDRLIYALSIPMVGETIAKKLARATINMDTLMSLDQLRLAEIEDIGPRIAESIHEFFANPINVDIINRLREHGVVMELPASEQTSASNILSGKTIVISGTFSHHSRDEYKAAIERNGGKNSGSVSKKTDFILAGENMGPAKIEKADRLGIPIISEDDFLRNYPDIF